MTEALKPCAGCGETDPAKRCIGCMHDFCDASSAWVKPYDEANTEALTPHQQATFDAVMGQRARLKPDADGLVPVRKENGNE